MVTINSSDFNIKTIKQKEDLRKKMGYKEEWDAVHFPDKDASLCNERDLQCLQKLLQSPSRHIHHDIYWSYEPMFLIKYEFEKSQILSNPDVEKLFEDKIKVLAKIAEYLIK